MSGKLYLNVKLGKKGEFVIPAIVRRKFGMRPGAVMNLDVEENRLGIIVKNPNVVDKIRALAKEANVKGKIIYGDALFENGFFE